MITIGLTGGIGMGKSTVAALMRGFGLPVYNADQAVHKLLSKNGKGVKPVAKLFPETLRGKAIDRKILGRIVFGHAGKLKKLEKILHVLVRQEEKKFLRTAYSKKMKAAVLEIPLLFETNSDKRCDCVICVTAPRAIQRKRVILRPGMTKEKLKAIQARQLADKVKRKRADYVINTSGSKADTKKRLSLILDRLLKE